MDKTTIFVEKKNRIPDKEVSKEANKLLPSFDGVVTKRQETMSNHLAL